MNVTGQPIAVRLERTIPAPPGQVYRAWLDPGRLARWMAPGSYAVTRAEVDERVGGHYRIWHADPSGTEIGGFDCELTELVPGQRIVFRWGFVGPERRDGPVFDSLLTVTLRGGPAGGTVLTLVHERLDDLAAALPGVAVNVGPGWEDVLGQLPASCPVRPGRTTRPSRISAIPARCSCSSTRRWPGWAIPVLTAFPG